MNTIKFRDRSGKEHRIQVTQNKAEILGFQRRRLPTVREANAHAARMGWTRRKA